MVTKKSWKDLLIEEDERGGLGIKGREGRVRRTQERIGQEQCRGKRSLGNMKKLVLIKTRSIQPFLWRPWDIKKSQQSQKLAPKMERKKIKYGKKFKKILF